MEEPTQTYEVIIDYDPDKHDLAKTLDGLSEVVAGDQKTTSTLLSLVDVEVTQKIIMQEISSGSIRLLLQNVLKNTTDQDIKEKGYKAFTTQLLIEAKRYILNYTQTQTQITQASLPVIRQGLIATARNSGLQNTIRLENISDEEILDCIDGITLPAQRLPEGQNVRAIYGGTEYVVNKSLQYDRVKIEETLTSQQTFANQILNIVVKKPDYIGNSKWDVYVEGGSKPIPAKILHKDWLEAFQKGSLPEGQVPLPTDGLRVRANIIRITNRFGTQITEECEIIEVLEVVKHLYQDRPKLQF